MSKPLSISTLQEHSAQEVFDFVAAHLLRQSVPSYAEGRCWYRSGANSCSIGCLMTDDEYKDEYENVGWVDLVPKYGFTREHFHMLVDLQDLHDYPASCPAYTGEAVEYWKRELPLIAEDYNLQWNFSNQ